MSSDEDKTNKSKVLDNLSPNESVDAFKERLREFGDSKTVNVLKGLLTGLGFSENMNRMRKKELVDEFIRLKVTLLNLNFIFVV